MATHASTEQSTSGTQKALTAKEMREDMYRLIDEMSNAQADRLKTLQAEFDALWKQLRTPEETLH
jgi:hypothetical protein